MATFLHIIWILLPLFFLVMALWSFLEKTYGKKSHERPGDFFSQGVFVTVCVAISFAIDTYVLPGLVESVSGDSVPYWVFQMGLLPFVLYIAAKVYGPSTPIRIAKAPNPSGRKSR